MNYQLRSTFYLDLIRLMPRSESSRTLDLHNYPSGDWWDTALEADHSLGNDAFVQAIAVLLHLDQYKLGQLLAREKGSRIIFYEVFSTMARLLEDQDALFDLAITNEDITSLVYHLRSGKGSAASIGDIIISGYPITRLIGLIHDEGIVDKEQWRMVFEENTPTEWVLEMKRIEAS